MMEIGENFYWIKSNQCLGKYFKILSIHILHFHESFSLFIQQVFIEHPGYTRHSSGTALQHCSGGAVEIQTKSLFTEILLWDKMTKEHHYGTNSKDHQRRIEQKNCLADELPNFQHFCGWQVDCLDRYKSSILSSTCFAFLLIKSAWGDTSWYWFGTPQTPPAFCSKAWAGLKTEGHHCLKSLLYYFF